jgi:hypothetical protein
MMGLKTSGWGTSVDLPQAVSRSSVPGKGHSAAMADMKNNNRVCLDGEQHPVLMRFPTVEELAHLKRKLDIFRSKGAAMRQFAERV